MKVLLDECLPQELRHHLPGHEVHSTDWAGFKGLKNGQLLREAELAGYEVLLTIDQSLVSQQSLARREISILVVRAKTNQLQDLLPAVDELLKILAGVRPGQFEVVDIRR